ncbi:unnamed protein product [Heligmosomoides polygyrus]|uniref:Amidohydrolase n=1 Tax=Heligmosomoides polygyrus TaxID=6339 RepID=A0A183GX80_HELPZ|nr:unnamed protein product [Heligmosomoides polygyrus]
MNTLITMVPREVHYMRGVEHEELVDFDAHLKYDTPLAAFLSLATQIGLLHSVEGTGTTISGCSENF